jgi:putative DNA primase/helicase
MAAAVLTGAAGREAVDIAEVVRRLAGNIEGLLAALPLPAPTPGGRTRAEARFGRKGSLKVNLKGGRGQWFDFEAGQGGDALDLIGYAQGCGKADALRWAREFLGGSALAPAARAAPAVPAADEAHRRRVKAVRLAGAAVSIAGTPAASYLAARGIAAATLAGVQDLGFLADLAHSFDATGARRCGGPVMLATVRDGAGVVAAVHCTWLAMKAYGPWVKAAFDPPRKMFGAVAGGAVRLHPVDDGTLGLAEGIESALSARQLFGVPVWAALSCGNLARATLPDGVERVRLFADGDEPRLAEHIGGEPLGPGTQAGKAMAKAVGAWRRAGRAVSIEAPEPVAGGKRDWNDVLRQRARAGGGDGR